MINIDKQNFLDEGEIFLNTIFGNLSNQDIGEIEIRVFPTGHPEQDFFTDHRDALEKAYDLCTNGIDVYFGVNPRIGSRGKKENVHYVTTFHAEIDYGNDGHKKKSVHENYDQALTTIDNFSMQPTAVIHSGGGFHCYWVLEKPLPVKKHGVAAIEAVNKFLSQQLGGDPGTQDISRVLRIPGTLNFKLPDNPRPVEVISLNGPKYAGESLIEQVSSPSVHDDKTTGVEPDIQSKSRLVMETPSSININSLPVSSFIRSLIKTGNKGKYPSRSEADMAVITALVNACVSDETIKQIFQQYPIGEKYHEHNDPERYLQFNIKKARELSELSDEERVNPLFLSGAIVKNGRKYHLDVVNFQELMTRHYQLKYIEDGSCFVRYNGKCYEYLTTENLNHLCQTELKQYRRFFSKNALRDFVHYGSGSEFYKSEKSSADMARYLTMGNGLYDLENYVLVPHTPDIFTTNLLPYDYDPEATCPRWLQFLDEIFLGDEEKIDFIQEAVGYSFLKEIPKPAMFFLVGDGSNGKSVFINTITSLIGEDNACSISLSSLSNEYYILSLHGKMINVCGETPRNRQINTDLVKAAVAGDWVTGRTPYKNPVKFKPFAKHFLAMNEIPVIEDMSHGMQRRIYPLEFTKTFNEDEMDVTLTEKLVDELPGIFNWAMVGYNRLKENNYIFSTGTSMTNAKNDYRRLSNNIYEFIEEHIVPSSSDARVTLKDAFLLYQKRCKEMNYSQLSRKDFKTAIINCGYRIDNSTRDANQVCIFGIELVG